MSAPPHGILAGDAHVLAGISYRQLDHWARQGWVTPSVDAGEGRSGRRLYSTEDVVRLDLLRHLAVSKVNPAVAGPLVAGCALPRGDVRIVWGPVGTKDPGLLGLRAVPTADTLAAAEAAGAWVVYNPGGVRARMRSATPQEIERPTPATVDRRTA